MSRLC